ncbi:uncharacterized protein LOC128549571 [Mercenaria mercenaria]|uniref:uncharacterized protein LOC128549571 n=1 Tax=Mercenaria mercenaria TaxID=6596 RepID=UPI00234F3074|nr:uncharacterized protein LOC128549571 [Mercenaria mercenaria]
MRLHVSKRNMPDESFSLNKFFSGIFIDEEGVKLVEDLSHEQIFVVVLQSVAEKPFVEQSHQFELQRAILEISSLLESVVFEILTVKCETLKQLYPLQANQSKENMKSSFSEMESQRNERARELLGEMFAFFNRSTLPKNKRMDVPGFERKRVSREITEKLFDLDKTIRGCGYSHSTFNVNVERLPGEKETMDRKERITKFLEKHGINDIKLNIVSESVAEYKRVGAGISIPKTEEGTEYHKGTLGGFASFSKEKETSSCALFSRHVAHGCIAKVYVDGENGKMTELGEILEDTLQAGSYDIAAAKIHDHHVPQCEVEFKNSENTPLPGRLYSPATIDLQDLQVHLWGSASKPGLGIIKIPELSYPNATETYIQIEDRNISKRMAAEGDSGAIVCADDLDDEHVHVISMLIGSNSDTKTLQDPNVKRTYIAFPVQKGVERLQMKTGGTFSLQGVSNDQ